MENWVFLVIKKERAVLGTAGFFSEEIATVISCILHLSALFFSGSIAALHIGECCCVIGNGK